MGLNNAAGNILKLLCVMQQSSKHPAEREVQCAYTNAVVDIANESSEECDEVSDYDIVRNCDKFESKQRRYGVTSSGNEILSAISDKQSLKPMRGSYSFCYGKRLKPNYLQLRQFSQNENPLSSDSDDESDSGHDVQPMEFKSSSNSDDNSDDAHLHNNISPETYDLLTSHFNSLHDSDHSANSPIMKSKFRKPSSEEALLQVKETATRLCLHTRRPSYQAWREQYIDGGNLSDVSTRPIRESVSEQPKDYEDESWEKISESLSWLRHELADLRAQDKIIAQQLLRLHREIQRLRLEKTCESHVDMLEDLRDELEGLNEICDLEMYNSTDVSYGPHPIKHLGITKLNLSERRFSTC